MISYIEILSYKIFELQSLVSIIEKRMTLIFLKNLSSENLEMMVPI